MASYVPRRERIALVEETIFNMRGRPSKKGWLRAPCPFCYIEDGKKDAKQSFGYNKFTLKYRCFKCGTYGTLPGEPEAPPPELLAAPAVEIIEPPEAFHAIGGNMDSPAVWPALEYLYGRGMTDELITWAGIGVCLGGRYRNRVVIPVFDETGTRWIGFVARAIFKGAFRPYLNADGPWASNIIYNGGCLEMETDVPAIAVEGCFDTFPFFPDGCAVFGKLGPEQKEILLRARRPFCMVLDGDAWREGEANAIEMKLRGAVCGSIRLPPKHDPDQISANDIRDAALLSLTHIKAVSL